MFQNPHVSEMIPENFSEIIQVLTANQLPTEDISEQIDFFSWKEDEKLIPLTALPQWAQSAFPNVVSLNLIQSRLYESAFHSGENLLICAPTGAGKTNIAMLSILQTVSLFLKPNGEVKTKNFKIVFIAPMKALVTEVVGNFSQRLSQYGMTV